MPIVIFHDKIEIDHNVIWLRDIDLYFYSTSAEPLHSNKILQSFRNALVHPSHPVIYS